MKKLLLLLFVGLSLQTLAQSGNWCAIEEFEEEAIKEDPEILERRAELEKFTQEYIKSNKKNEEKIIIPVVFHVLHEYGPEYLTYEDIQRGMEQMNKDWNAQNSDIGTIIPQFQDIIGVGNIEFRLAKLDPDGNCTNGVVYYDTPLTYQASNSLKYTIENWDPHSYLNIWTVSSIASGAAAWSHYPGVSSYLDGVVSIYRYVISGHTLAHEVGHYLNLAHPWGNSNEPGLASNCNMDDGVEDTPETIGADQNCNKYQESCGSLDNVQNIMDYSTCDAMFTIGQMDRARAALNSSVGGRKYLWTEENLMATGTSDNYSDPGCAPIANFDSYIPDYCTNADIEFKDFSNGNEISQWQWEFEGGTPSTSSDQNPIVYFEEPGSYNVKLTVSNNAGSHSILRENHVFIPDTTKGIIAPVEITMEDSDFPYFPDDEFKSWKFIENGKYHWEKKSAIMTNGMAIKNYGNDEGTINSMITPNIDLSKIDNPDYIYFDLAYAQRNSSSLDELKIFVSANCGDNWQIKYIKSGASLASIDDYKYADFKPALSEWKTEKISISNFSEKNHIRIKFLMKSRGGNYLYIDNLRIGEVTSVEMIDANDLAYEIYPNPAQKTLNVSYKLESYQKVNLDIVNLVGQKVLTLKLDGEIGLNENEINLGSYNLNSGIYAVSLSTNNYKISKKLIIK